MSEEILKWSVSEVFLSIHYSVTQNNTRNLFVGLTGRCWRGSEWRLVLTILLPSVLHRQYTQQCNDSY
jgi:hypothetical protein